MARWTAGVLGMLSVALAVAAVVQSRSLRETREELDAVRAKVEKMEARQKDAGPAHKALQELREEIARVDRKAEARPLAAAADAAGKPGALPTLVTEEDIRKIVDEAIAQKVEDKVEEKVKAKGGGGLGDRKMPLHDMAKELALDPAVQAKVADIANVAKKDIFTIISTPRADGTCVTDELIEVMLKGDAPAMQQLFAKLLTEKIPGTDTTYFAGAENVKQKAHQQLQLTMGAESYARYKHMQVHPNDIQTGYDPFAEYITQKGIDPAKFGKPK